MITPASVAKELIQPPVTGVQWRVMNDSQSPSLARDSKVRSEAKEVKFVVSDELAAELEGRIAGLFTRDPHCVEGGGYSLASIYCDSPSWDVYYRRGRYRYCKYRIRRYGDTDVAHLERKVKKGYQVRKKRCELHLDLLPELSASDCRIGEGACKYRSHLSRQSMKPVCLIRYDRTAYFGALDNAPVRMTFDRSISGLQWAQWSFNSSSQCDLLIPGFVVCEFKFRGSMPNLLRDLVHQFSISPTGISKYRRCVEYWNLVAPDKAGA